MKEFIKKLIESFENNPKGFSGRKLTAFTLVMCVVAAHVKWLMFGDFTHLEMVLTIDYAFIASLFGLTTIQAIKKNTVAAEAAAAAEQEINDETKV